MAHFIISNYKHVDSRGSTWENTPVNLDVVVSVHKTNSKVREQENVPSLMFFVNKDVSIRWLYDNVTVRDYEYQLIINNKK